MLPKYIHHLYQHRLAILRQIEKKVNETCTHTQRKTKTKIKLGDEDVLSSNTWQFKSPNFCQRIGMQAFGLNTTLSFTF